MKASEILGTLPKWANATPKEIVASPAWALPCRLGETSCTMRLDGLRPADTLDISIVLEDEPHILSIIDTPRFADLHAIWAERANVPQQIMLALVEKECGPLLQLVENATRRQLKVAGLANETADAGAERLCARICTEDEELLSFSMTSSPMLLDTFGKLLFIDTGHASVREESLSAESEIAVFALPAADTASLAPGDALLLPEVGTVSPRLVVDGRFLVDETGVSPFNDDGRLRVLDAEPHSVSLGYLFDHAQTPATPDFGTPTQLRLVASGKTIATGNLGKIADNPAFIVESSNR